MNHFLKPPPSHISHPQHLHHPRLRPLIRSNQIRNSPKRRILGVIPILKIRIAHLPPRKQPQNILILPRPCRCIRLPLPDDSMTVRFDRPLHASDPVVAVRAQEPRRVDFTHFGHEALYDFIRAVLYTPPGLWMSDKLISFLTPKRERQGEALRTCCIHKLATPSPPAPSSFPPITPLVGFPGMGIGRARM